MLKKPKLKKPKEWEWTFDPEETERRWNDPKWHNGIAKYMPWCVHKDKRWYGWVDIRSEDSLNRTLSPAEQEKMWTWLREKAAKKRLEAAKEMIDGLARIAP